MCVFFHASANDDIKEVIIILFQLDYKLVPKMRLLLKFWEQLTVLYLQKPNFYVRQNEYFLAQNAKKKIIWADLDI